MIAKLEKEGEAAAQEKAWCDEQMSKTELKKSELDEDIEKVAIKVEEAAAKSAQLKAGVKQVQASLAALAKEQADMDKIRQEENAAYKTAKADLEMSLNGVQKALQVLKDYYGSSAALLQQPAPPQGHSASGGAGGSIIDILELCESDFADNLAKVESEEADAVDEYKKVCQENKVARAGMEQDVKYQTQEFTGLDKSIAEWNADGDSAKAELASVLKYYEEIKGRCIAKPDSHEEQMAKRQAEIDGLKQAIQILNEQAAAFVQKRRRGNIRGAALEAI